MTIGVLPGELGSENPYVRVPIATGLGEARNAVVVRTAHAVIAIGGSYGTLSEIGFALKIRRPVVGLNTWELASGGFPDGGIRVASSPEEAVELVMALLAE